MAFNMGYKLIFRKYKSLERNIKPKNVLKTNKIILKCCKTINNEAFLENSYSEETQS